MNLKDLLINWVSSVETTQLGIYVRVYETGCEIYLDTTITISENIAPPKYSNCTKAKYKYFNL